MNGRTLLPGEPKSESVRPPMVYVKEPLTWQYRQIVRDLAKEEAPGEAELNALGAEGWELVGVVSTPPRVYFYFKRLAR